MEYHGQWTFSTNEEMFTYGEYFKDKKEAIEAGREYFEGSSFYVGQVEDIGIRFVHIAAEEVLETIGDRVYDEVGEVAEQYLTKIPKEQEQELENEINAVLEKWITKHGYEPTFFKVINTEKVEGTEA